MHSGIFCSILIMFLRLAKTAGYDLLFENLSFSHPTFYKEHSVVAQLCLTLCNPMNRRTPGLPVHHQLPEFTQTHVHRVGDAIQPSHPLSPLLLLPPVPPSIRGFSNESTLHIRWPKYWVSASATVLPMNTQDWSSEWTGWISLQSKGLSRVFSNTTIQKHQFFGAQLSSRSNSRRVRSS